MDTFECFNVAHFRRREKEEEKVWRFVNKRERVYHKINEEFQSYLQNIQFFFSIIFNWKEDWYVYAYIHP